MLGVRQAVMRWVAVEKPGSRWRSQAEIRDEKHATNVDDRSLIALDVYRSVLETGEGERARFAI